MGNLIRVAMDNTLQKEFETNFKNFLNDYEYLNNRIQEHTSNIKANREDLIINIEYMIFKLRETEKQLKNIEQNDYTQEIDIPFTFNCVECGTELKTGDDFNYCKRCLDDYYVKQSFTN